MNIRTFVTILSRNPQYNFPKMRGGQRLFGTFPRVHPFWRCEASIRGCSYVNDVISNHIYIHGLLVLCWQTSVSQSTKRKRTASQTRNGRRKVAKRAAARLMVRWSNAPPTGVPQESPTLEVGHHKLLTPLGTSTCTRFDEFLENFQTASELPENRNEIFRIGNDPPFRKFIKSGRRRLSVNWETDVCQHKTRRSCLYVCDYWLRH